jgi:hypothetical protein
VLAINRPKLREPILKIPDVRGRQKPDVQSALENPSMA